MKNTLLFIIEAAARRGLPCLLIGGHAVILLGFPRNTIDVDLLVPLASRSAWLDLLRDLQFRLYHGSDSFAQFEPGGAGMVSVDLMFVDDRTWSQLSSEPLERVVSGHSIKLPRPEHLMALKLHAASSVARGKPEVDWEDIRQIVNICGIDPADPGTREIILRYGGEEALQRVESFRK